VQYIPKTADDGKDAKPSAAVANKESAGTNAVPAPENSGEKQKQ
jgi:hypothetical protein